MDSLLTYHPKQLTFTLTPGSQTATLLTLSNPSPHPVAYKVKTTHVKRYCVRPNASILSPSQTLIVELVQQSFPTAPPDLNDCRDRFLLQAISLSSIPSLPSSPTPAQVWEHASPSLIHKVKFNVRLQLATQPPVSPTPPTPLPAPLPPPLPPKPPVAPPAPPVRSPGNSNATDVVEELPVETSVKPPLVSALPQPKQRTEGEMDKVSVARARALGVRPAPRGGMGEMGKELRWRVAIEREAELRRLIKEREDEIKVVSNDLKEERHRLSDANVATGPAREIGFVIDEDAKVGMGKLVVMGIVGIVVVGRLW